MKHVQFKMEGLLCKTCLLAVILCLPEGTQSKAVITKMAVNSIVSVRFADVNITSSVENNAKKGEELTFEIQMPVTAFITRFAIIVNGEVNLAEIEEAKKAQEIYKAAVENDTTTGLITQQVRVNENFDMEVFRVQVFIPGNSFVDFQLQYQELLERRLGFYSQRIYLRPKQVVPVLSVTCHYNEPQGFSSFTYNLPTADREYVKTEFTDFSRKIEYVPSEASQISEGPYVGLNSVLTVEYDVNHEVDGGLVLESDSHFAHYFSPECEDDQVMSKRIVFIIDKSGSMKSPKIDHVKIALKTILLQLRETDDFNIVTFNDRIYRWGREMLEASSENVARAVRYVDEGISASGATNINEALLQGIRIFKNEQSEIYSRKANILVFLTDGEPTNGITDTTYIRELVLAENTNGDSLYTSIYSLAFGTRTEVDFLKRLAWSNNGNYRAVRDTEEAGDIILSFFREVQNPYLQDVRFEYSEDESGSPVSLTRTEFPQYFCGSELVVSGQIESPPPESQTESSGWELAPRVYATDNNDSVEFQANRRIKSASENSAFLTRLYIYKQIKDLLKQAEAEAGLDDGLRNDLNAMALNLSLTHGFVTKLTSLVVHSVKSTERKYSKNVAKTRSGNFGSRPNFGFYGTSTTYSSTTLQDGPVFIDNEMNGGAPLKSALFMSVTMILLLCCL